jgi:putative heme-binding domain-containing protein
MTAEFFLSTTHSMTGHLNRLSLYAILLLLISCSYFGQVSQAAAPPQHIVQQDPLSPAEQQTKFHLPPGFEIQLVASEPEISKPINLNFDAAGRLLVTQSVEYPYAAKGIGRDSVARLTIDPKSGKATKVETIIEGLNIPIGVTPLGSEVIVYTIPEILRCADKDGDGKFESRQSLYQGFGHVDTHGMNNGFTRHVDGWVYACHGFRNESKSAGTDGQELSMQSGNTYRFRDDGSHIEVFTRGQVNPFGLCFDPLGNLYSADCHSRPAYLLLRGAYYPSFGKPHDGLGYGPEIMTHSHGSTGIAGVVYYEADHFPAAYQGKIFIGNPITARINADTLVPHGSTYTAQEEPNFLSCDDPWCRPVDLQLGPDGALYFADFYNRIIGHYEVPLDHPGRDRQRGRIWRIIYIGEVNSPVPQLVDLTTADVETLVQQLSSANISLRSLAVHELVDRIGQPAIPVVKQLFAAEAKPSLAQSTGMWVLNRLHALDEETVQRLATNPLPEVRVNLCKLLADKPEWSAAEAQLVRSALKDENFFVQRAAAEALGLHADEANLLPLLTCWKSAAAEDSMLIHTVRMALRNHLQSEAVLGGKLLAKLAAGEEQKKLFSVLPGTGSPAAALFALKALPLQKAPNPPVLVHFLVRQIPEPDLSSALEKIQQAYADMPATSAAGILLAIKQALGERGQQLPVAERNWAIQCTNQLLSDPSSQTRGMELAKELKLSEVYDKIEPFILPDATDSGIGSFTPLQSLALEACVVMDAERTIPKVKQLLTDDGLAMPMRQKAAEMLGRINTAETQQLLLTHLRIAPEPLDASIAVALGSSKQGAETLMTEIEAGKASSRLLQNRNVANVLIYAQVSNAQERIAKLTANLPPRPDRITELINTRREHFLKSPGDAERGLKIFTKSCANCHKVGSIGNKIGPELDGIGNRGLLRVMEDVLDPSRNVDGAFRTTLIATADGRTIAGLLLREEGETLILANNEGKEIRIAAAEVEERSISPLSPMPANVAELVPEKDFQDLLAFLMELRQKQTPEEVED